MPLSKVFICLPNPQQSTKEGYRTYPIFFLFKLEKSIEPIIIKIRRNSALSDPTETFIILFTFDNDETKKQYVVYQDPQNDSGDVYASIYDDKGNLYPIESDEEWDMVEEVINTFVEDEEDA